MNNARVNAQKKAFTKFLTENKTLLMAIKYFLQMQLKHFSERPLILLREKISSVWYVGTRRIYKRLVVVLRWAELPFLHTNERNTYNNIKCYVLRICVCVVFICVYCHFVYNFFYIYLYFVYLSWCKNEDCVCEHFFGRRKFLFASYKPKSIIWM